MYTGWARLRGDFNHDLQVDGTDVQFFGECATGPAGMLPRAPCSQTDLDGDEHVDMRDFAILQRCFGNLQIPPAAVCAY